MKEEPVGIRSARIQASAIIIAAVISALLAAWLKGCFKHESNGVVRTSGTSSPAIQASGDNNKIYNFQGDIVIYSAPDVVKAITEKVIRPKPEEKEPWKIIVEGKVITPEEGKFYSSKISSGIQVSYMVKDGLMHVEHTDLNGKKWYKIFDKNGGLIDGKFPYNIEEFQLIIPEDLELSRNITPLPNGFRKIDVKLKWGKSVSMIVDAKEKLQQFRMTGGMRVEPSEKKIYIK